MKPTKKSKEIGQRLETLRKRAGHTTEALAHRAGVSAAEIEAIESGRVTANVGQLVNLGRALGVSPGTFLEADTRPHRVEVVRATDRWRVERDASESAASLSYSYEALSFRLSDRLMQPFLIEVRLQPGEAVQPSQHDGEEFVYVLEGDLDLEIGNEVHRLSAGDSAYYDSRFPHVLRSTTARPPRAIVVLATASAAAHHSAFERAF